MAVRTMILSFPCRSAVIHWLVKVSLGKTYVNFLRQGDKGDHLGRCPVEK